MTDLSRHAIGVLRDAAARPIPTQEINPGVTAKLTREHLAHLVSRPSPYKKHKGAPIEHLVPTVAGLALLDGL